MTFYRYHNDLYHDKCVADELLVRVFPPPSASMRDDPEAFLDRAARFLRVDRNNPHSFSDSEFPQAFEATGKDLDQRCPHCQKPIQEKD